MGFIHATGTWYSIVARVFASMALVRIVTESCLLLLFPVLELFPRFAAGCVCVFY